MALIPGFEYDIFISYVHTDNESEIKDREGWISQFYKYLDTKLSKHSKKVKIWWDDKNLDRTEFFDDSIEEAIKKSAIMICVYSRNFEESYCVKELDSFCEKADQEGIGVRIGNRTRVIPVLISNIHHTDWLPAFKGTSGLRFHDGKTDEAYGDPLEIESGAFRQQMKKLRNELVKTFEELSQNDPVVEEKNTYTFTIFMAEVDDELIDRRENIVSKLRNNGFKVLIGDPSSKEVQDHFNNTKELIGDAQLSVHMFGRLAGKKIIGDPTKRYISTQFEIGIDSVTEQLIWMGSNTQISDIENEEYASFLLDLEQSNTGDKFVEFVRSDEAELSKIIIDYAKQLKARAESEKLKIERAEGSSAKVLLDTHADDFSSAFQLRKNLITNDIDLIFNPEDGSPQENIELLYENIKEAKKFIFLYGKKENHDWIDFRVEKIMQKLVEYGRFTQDIYIYMTAPEKEHQSVKASEYPLVKIFDNSKTPSLNTKLFQELLTELKV